MQENKSRQNLIQSLYLESFPDVAKYIAKKGGSLEDAKEIFQEAIVAYYESIIVNEKAVNTSNKAYLFGICRNLWSRQFQKNLRLTALDNYDTCGDESPAHTERLASYLKAAGERCMNLLQSFYYEKLSMHELAKRFGYGSERSATVQKFKCLEKVRDEVKSKSLTYEDFIA